MIYKMEADNKFPKRIKIGLRAVGWIEEEIVQWIEARIAFSRVSPRES
jgi:prophage regulatory protein